MKVKIITQNPISITTGNKYFKDEYFVFGNFLYRVNINKFLECLSNEEKKEFNKIIMEVNKKLGRNPNDEIKEYEEFFISKISKNISNALPEWIKYKLQLKNISGRISQASINEIIKEPLTNKPIIPGSSIKGALRTVLIREYLKYNSEYKNKIKEELRNYGINIINKIEEDLFCIIKYGEEKDSEKQKGKNKDKSYQDIMRLIQVSDFVMKKGSISVRKLVREGTSKGGLDLYYETVDEGSEFEGTISIVKNKVDFKDQGVMKILKELSEERLSNFVTKIHKIGFGKGFREQTILFDIFDIKNYEDQNFLKKFLSINFDNISYKIDLSKFPKTRIVDPITGGWANIKVEVNK